MKWVRVVLAICAVAVVSPKCLVLLQRGCFHFVKIELIHPSFLLQKHKHYASLTIAFPTKADVLSLFRFMLILSINILPFLSYLSLYFQLYQKILLLRNLLSNLWLYLPLSFEYENFSDVFVFHEISRFEICGIPFFFVLFSASSEIVFSLDWRYKYVFKILPFSGVSVRIHVLLFFLPPTQVLWGILS